MIYSDIFLLNSLFTYEISKKIELYIQKIIIRSMLKNAYKSCSSTMFVWMNVQKFVNF